MSGIVLAAFLFTHHGNGAYDWHITCDRFLELKIEIQFDEELDTRSKRNLIQFFKSKVAEECNDLLL